MSARVVDVDSDRSVERVVYGSPGSPGLLERVAAIERDLVALRSEITLLRQDMRALQDHIDRLSTRILLAVTSLLGTIIVSAIVEMIRS